MVETTPYQPISLTFVQKDRYCSGNTPPKTTRIAAAVRRRQGAPPLRVTPPREYKAYLKSALAETDVVAFARALLTGQAAQEYDPGSKAAAEVELLHTFIIKRFHSITPSQSGVVANG